MDLFMSTHMKKILQWQGHKRVNESHAGLDDEPDKTSPRRVGDVKQRKLFKLDLETFSSNYILLIIRMLSVVFLATWSVTGGVIRHKL